MSHETKHTMSPDELLAGIARCEAERTARLAARPSNPGHQHAEACCPSCATGHQCESTCNNPMLFNAGCGVCPTTPPEKPPEF